MLKSKGNRLHLLAVLFTIHFGIVGQEVGSKKVEKIYVKKESVGDTIVVLSKPAEYVGGYSELYKFINNKIKLPDSVQRGLIGGAVYVSFTVTDSGKVKDAKLMYKMRNCAECNSEALRLVKLLTKYIPASEFGKYISSIVTIPIYFTPPKNQLYKSEDLYGKWRLNGYEDLTCIECPVIVFQKDNKCKVVNEEFSWTIKNNILQLNPINIKTQLIILKDSTYEMTFERYFSKLILIGPTTTYYLYKNNQ